MKNVRQSNLRRQSGATELITDSDTLSAKNIVGRVPKFLPVNVLDVVRFDIKVFSELVNEVSDDSRTDPLTRMYATVNEYRFVALFAV